MAQARTHRDQGSLSSLVYSFFPDPASCQAPLPAVGLPSPCTVSSLPALLPAASPASGLSSCTSGNLPEHLPDSSLSASLHFSRLALLQTSRITCTSNLVSSPTHPQLSLSCHLPRPPPPIPLFLLSFFISPSLSTPSSLSLLLPHLPPAPSPPLRVLSSDFSAVTDYSAKTPALRSGWERAAMSGEDPLAQGCSLLARPRSGCLQGARGGRAGRPGLLWGLVQDGERRSKHRGEGRGAATAPPRSGLLY